MDVRTLCLGALYLGEASGYEIKKAFEEGPFSHFQDASFGSIYPALGRLSNEGLVDCTQMAQEKRPDKKVYRLTEKGSLVLIESLMTPPAPDKVTSDFFFLLYFSDLLPPRQTRQLIDKRIAFYQDTIKRMSDCDPSTFPLGQQLCHGLGMTIYKSSLDYLEQHKHAFPGEASSLPPLSNSKTSGRLVS
ncbi:PadR family transcriptional regulator [Kiloniella laminariae]|uniref:PadR family transcriptional regulator n=1 Tax=Kiloniella laminariae TaxID=454162 RepID=A0ABT4LHM8_9PROT|nr:PadR family transcriptional regulator [Kiloniella laminariae]MCZ4280455.1 PadR family transcriptional regulator [Kiloniella laminariae]